MFTGLVQHVGRVAGATPTPAGRRLRIDPAGWAHAPSPGDSISVNGCCLTLVGGGAGGEFHFDAVPETLAKTTLGGWAVGRRVNLEHAVTAGTYLGGHVVQGHVDGLGEVRANGEMPGRGWLLRLAPDAPLMRYMVPRGSVCVDGVSLTLARVDMPSGEIEIALIPETLARTTLGDLRPGDRVNLECDVLAKTVAHYLEHVAPGSPGAR
jgi:riboflavin synthase